MAKPEIKNTTWRFLGLLLVVVLMEAFYARVYYKMFFEPRSMLYEFAWFYFLVYLVVMSTCIGIFAALFASGGSRSPGLWGFAGFLLTLLVIWFSPDLIQEGISPASQLALFLLIPLMSTAVLTFLIALLRSLPSKLEDEKAE
jgi:hypothetical protein